MGISDELKNFLSQCFDLLQIHFGEEVEFVLHDLSLEYEHTIIDIRNGEITQRTIGDTGDILGLEVLRGSIEDGNSYNLINYTLSGKTLRSSTQFIKDTEGNIIASIGINEDITKSIEFERYLQRKNKAQLANTEKPNLFHGNINAILNQLLDNAQYLVGKHTSQMDKNDKIAFIRYLDQQGAFLISKSSIRVCEVLGISKFTLYHYLDIARENQKASDKDEQEES